ncbi:MAG: nicotinate-nucleotide adenylyltransferase [Chitinispirillales bacterium]|jgi:nicotinate-nucleotide adenylyltransferase|nr:nicotinate-nucleotide adenylyltransferase [Chitinispirillales bacterium]
MTDKRIGILGGVFDPVHCGHLSIAVLAREYFGLDKIIFIPSGIPPHKFDVTTSSDDRLNMLKLALDGIDGCEIWEGEIRRGGYSYTIDTLKELGDIYGGAEFYFIVGTDNLTDIPKWRSYEDIIKLITLCVAFRPGYEFDRPGELSLAKIETFPGPEWGASSTMLRKYIKNGHSCRFMIPDATLAYIRKKGLYGYLPE